MGTPTIPQVSTASVQYCGHVVRDRQTQKHTHTQTPVTTKHFVSSTTQAKCNYRNRLNTIRFTRCCCLNCNSTWWTSNTDCTSVVFYTLIHYKVSVFSIIIIVFISRLWWWYCGHFLISHSSDLHSFIVINLPAETIVLYKKIELEKYKYQLTVTNPRDALHHGKRTANKGRRSVW